MNKSPYFLFLAFCFTCINVFSQAPSWSWAKSAVCTGIGANLVEKIAVDDFGNSFAVGEFSMSGISFGTFSLSNSGISSNDVFLVKLNPLGVPLWAISFGGSASDFCYGVAVDALGNSYVTGYFDGPTMTIESTTLVNASSTASDMYIAKFNSSGNLVWAKNYGGSGFEHGLGISVDKLGNSYATGSYVNTDSLDFAGSVIVNTGGQDIYIVKHDTFGNVVWAKSAGGLDNEEPHSIATNDNGVSAITGYFESADLYFDSIQMSSSSATWGAADFFVAQYDSSGNAMWANIGTGNGIDEGWAAAIDSIGNVFATGAFISPTFNLGSDSLINTDAFGYEDIFLIKYNVAGTLQWAKKAYGQVWDRAQGIAIDSDHNIYLTGYFYSDTLLFDTVLLLKPGATSSSVNMFVVKYNNLGDAQWAVGVGDSIDGVWAYGIDVTPEGSVYVVGDFNTLTAVFGSTILTLGTGRSIFISKLGTDVIQNVTSGSEAHSFTIYPNPYVSSSTISYQLDSQSNVKIEFFDLLGRRIETLVNEIQKAGKYTIAVTNNGQLAEGNVFFVRMIIDGKPMVKKIIQIK